MFGLGWALAVGTWLALPAQPVATVEGMIAPHAPGAAVFFLRTLEIVAAIIGVGLSVAAAVVMLLCCSWSIKALSIDRACGKPPRS
jgi:hypothetical protein